jgi:hypothetical protein
VKSGPPPSSGGTSSSSGNPSTTHVNPPRATDGAPPGTAPNTDPTTPSVQQTEPAPPTTQANLRTWHVTQRSDKSCYASLKVECPPKPATCNPPPAVKLASCPDGLQMPQGMTIHEESANSCALHHPMPDCPPGMACNPPRPQSIECPKY